MERRFQVLVRAIADHDRVAVVQGRYIDRQIGDRPHLVIDDHQLAVHQVVDDLRDILVAFARDERVWLLREAKDQRLARCLGVGNRYQRTDRQRERYSKRCETSHNRTPPIAGWAFQGREHTKPPAPANAGGLSGPATLPVWASPSQKAL